MAKLKTGPKVRRKGGGVAAKAKMVASLAEQLAGAPAMVLTEYRGLTVRELQDLRRKLRPRGVEYHVVKNTLFARAADQVGRSAVRPLLSGPTAVAVAAAGQQLDEAELARSLVDELRTFRALRIVGAMLDSRVFSADEVQSLARLPARPQLQAALVGTLLSPMGTLVSTLQAPFANLVYVLTARGRAA